MRPNFLFQTSAALLLIVGVGCGPSKVPPPQTTSTARLPFGALDNPPDGATVKGTVTADGWGLSEDGVDHVAIYLDRNYLQDATVKGKRDDVVKVYPDFASVEDMRFFTELHAEKLPVGRHELSAKVISRKGGTRDLPPHFINIAH